MLLAAAHALVAWSIWRIEVPLPPDLETFTSVLFWAPRTKPATSPGPVRPLRTRASRTPPSTQRLREAVPDLGNAITLPANPGAAVDWSTALKAGAATEFDKEERAAGQLGALRRKLAVADDPRDPHPGPSSGFRWDDAVIHRIDTRGSIPGLWLNDHCVLLAFVIPACKIGHIEIHGDLFEGAALVHVERLATPRPNDAP